MTNSDLFTLSARADRASLVSAGGGWSSPYYYAWGYAEAASRLVDEAHTQESQSMRSQDLLFYPICFLYRHAFELTLKGILYDLERLLLLLVEVGGLGEDKTCSLESLEKKLAKTHNLGKLRDRLVLKLGYTGDSAIDSSVLSAVQLLDQLDPTGQLFRYAEVRAEDGGFAPSFEEYMEVDLHQIKTILSPAVEYLCDGVGE